jgi:23S rRNA pseudouridine2605 synthase
MENNFRKKKSFAKTANKNEPSHEKKQNDKVKKKSSDSYKTKGFTTNKTDNKNSEKNKKIKGKDNQKVTKPKEAPAYKLNAFEKRKTNKSSNIRLNKYIANAGVCSRREADELITKGLIKVNGKVITEMGYQVKPSDKVSYQGKTLNREKLVYILLNKPKNCITTTDDPEERTTVMEIVKDACEERIYPVGRLDRNTTGLLLLTNDGDLAKKLSHPSSNIKKVYQVTLDKPITEEDFLAIEKGLELEDGFIKPDALAALTPNTLGIELHSGRNRIVRRIFEHLGYQVEKLDRTMYAGLTKKDLPRGKWRFLTQKEVIMLKYLLK